MTESTMNLGNDDGAGTSHDADVDAGFGSSEQGDDSVLGGDLVDTGPSESHEADVDAGYNDGSQ